MRRFKRMLSLLLAVIMLLSTEQLTLSALAEGLGELVRSPGSADIDAALDAVEPVQAPCGTSLTWVLESGTLTISGTGRMEDYAAGAAPWSSSAADITAISLPIGLTYIGSHAFDGCTEVRRVSIPEKVSEIGAYAFANMAELTHVTLGEKLEKVGVSAFYQCEKVETIVFKGEEQVPDGCGSNLIAHLPKLATVKYPACLQEAYFAAVAPYFPAEQTVEIILTGETSTAAPSAEPTEAPTAPAPAFPLDSLLGGGNLLDADAPLAGDATAETTIAPDEEPTESATTEEPSETPAAEPTEEATEEATNMPTPTEEATEAPTEEPTPTAESTPTVEPTEAPTPTAEPTEKPTPAEEPTEEPTAEPTEEPTPTPTPEPTEEPTPTPTPEPTEEPTATPASTEAPLATGTCGNNLTWVLTDDGTLTISGEGMMANYRTGEAPWNGYRDNINTVVVEDGVTSIGESAFQSCTSLTNITLPDTLTHIFHGAFDDCALLKYIVIPASVCSIEASVFSNCNSLIAYVVQGSLAEQYCENFEVRYCHFQSGDYLCKYRSDDTVAISAYVGPERDLILPNQINGCVVAGIGYAAFRDCASLSNITLPDSVTSIGVVAFSGCTGLQSVTLPSKLTSIGKNMFSGCTALQSVILPDGVTEIGSNAFYDCTALTSITLPSKLSKIANYAFKNCSSLKILTIPEGVTTIGNDAFYGCTALTSIELPSTLISIGNTAFQACTSLKSVTIPDGVTSIEYNTFRECGALTEVNLPSTLTSIGGSAFQACESMESIVIPNGVTTIDNFAFHACFALTTITFTGTTPPSFGEHSVLITSSLTKVYVPGAAYDAYVTALDGKLPEGAEIVGTYATVATGTCGDNLTWVLTDDGTLTISGTGAMAGYNRETTPWYEHRKSITSVVVEDGVTSIGAYAFDLCTEMSSITLPDGLTSIGNSAFWRSTTLDCVIIPNSVTSIGSSAFYGCTALTSITLPKELVTIAESTFDGCTTLAELTLPDTLTSIGRYAFRDCAALTSLDLPDGLTAISSSTFASCTGLQSVTLPDGLTQIGDTAFYGCTGLTGELVLPSNVTSLGERAFANCTSLTSISLGGAITTRSKYTPPFNGCSNVQSITLRNDSIDANTLTYVTSGLSALEKIYVSAASYVYYMGILGSAIPSGVRICVLDTTDDFCIVDGTLIVYQGTASEVTIPEGVTAIGNYAFYHCTGLTSVSIPEGVTAIGSYALSNCTALTSVTLPTTLTAISQYAFYNCKALPNITLPETLTILGNYAFYNCTALTEITIPDSLTSIGQYAFYNCAALTSITLPSTLTSIGNYAFCNCKTLTSIDLPDGLTTIGGYVFQNCTSLESVTLPDGLTTIGVGAFYGCGNLTGITLPDSLTAINNAAFSGCTGLTGELVIPDNVTTLGEQAFKNCTRLTSISLGSTLNTPSSYNPPFSGCSNVQFITLRNDSISNSSTVSYVISGLSALEKLYVPAASYARYMSILSSAIPSGVRICVLDTTDDFCIVDGTLIVYQGTASEVTIPEGVTAIGDQAFRRNTKLTSITIPEGVTAIDNYTFSGCTALTSVTLPTTLTSIGSYAFSSCTKLTSITIPDGVTTIGSSAFYYCTDLTSIKLPDSLTTIGSSTFNSCTKLAEVTLPKGLTKIEGNAFRGCKVLTSIDLPDSLTTIGSYVFENCTSLESVTLPDGLTTIDSYAFRNCTGLTSINLPNSLTSIGGYAFSGCTGLTEVAIPEKITSISSNLFQKCTALTTVALPDSLTYIGDYAFDGCASLTTINLPSSLQTIRQYAFSGCAALTGELVIPDKVGMLRSGAFQDCAGLTAITLGKGLTASNAISGAFSGCTGVTTLTFRLSSIGWSNAQCAVWGLTNLEKIYVPGNYASCMSNLRNYIASTVRVYVTGVEDEFYIVDGTLIVYQGDDSKATVPEGVTAIGNYAFYNCAELESVTLPESVITIGIRTFDGCTSLSSINLPEGLTTINGAAFSGCKALTSLTFPSTLTTFSSYFTFSNCTGITQITFMGAAPENVSQISDMKKLERVYVPAEHYNDYAEKLDGKLPSGAKLIADYIKVPVSGLEATAVYSRTAVLTWDSHPGMETETVGYIISRDGVEIARTTETTCTDRAMPSEGDSTYTVCAYTEDGRTTPAATLTVTPAMPSITSISTDSQYDRVDGDHRTVYICIPNGTNLLPLGDEQATVALYLVSGEEQALIADAVRSDTLSNEDNVVYTTVWNIDGLDDGAYTVRAILTDVDGATAQADAKLTVACALPSQIRDVSAIGDLTKIHITWTISRELTTGTYRIYRRAAEEAEFMLLKEITNRSTLRYEDTTAEAGITYEYYVTGVDEFGKEGEPSDKATATLSEDNEAPQLLRLTPANGSYISKTTAITVEAQDNTAVTLVRLYYSIDTGDEKTWTLLHEMTESPYTASLDTTVLKDGVVYVRAIAYDAAGNQNEMTYTYAIDNQGPEQVTGLGYVSTSVTVTLSWGNVADEDVASFLVERRTDTGAYELVTTVYRTLGVNLLGLTPDTEYTYRVTAYDQQGNMGIPSEDITVKTAADTTAPVITNLAPKADYYASSIPLTAVAQDEYAIARMEFQVSRNQISWTTIYTETFEGDASAKRSLAYTYVVEDEADGSIYVRAIAWDIAGNMSDTSLDAPYVQYIVDRTAPAAPTEVTAALEDGVIEISWVQGTEEDLYAYNVYRAEGESGLFLQVRSSLASLSFIDRDLEANRTYCYQVEAVDRAGNVSERSAVTESVQLEADLEQPTIHSIYPDPAQISTLGTGFRTIKMLAVDNRKLATVRMEYSFDNGTTYTELASSQEINDVSCTLSADLPLDGLADGATVLVRFTATDAAGNTSEPKVCTYTVDAIAPTLTHFSAKWDAEAGNVLLSWTSGSEEDLSHFRLYRREKLADDPTDDASTDANFCIFSHRSALADVTEYTRTDKDLSDEAITYIYLVEAIDAVGNTTCLVSAPVSLPDRSTPVPIISCESFMFVETDYIIDASLSKDNKGIVSYLIDFGDGTETTRNSKPVHQYAEEGEYTITLTVRDTDDNEATTTKTVTVKGSSTLGTAIIQVVDEDGLAVPNAAVYFDLGHAHQVIRYTDGQGYATFTAEAGKHTVGCIIADNEWLPVTKEIIVCANSDFFTTLTMVHHTLIEGKFEITRMTFEEIKAAGIDVSDPENQHIVQVNVKLTYTDQTANVTFGYNELTGVLITFGIGKGNFGGGGGTGSGGSNDDGDSDNDSGNSSKNDDDDDNDGRVYYPDIIDASDGIANATIAILDMPVQASFLKEFFDVKLHIINNASSEFAMVNNVVTLNVPDGMSVVDTAGTEASSTIAISRIGGGETKTINWILRGDMEGSYPLSADYVGTLTRFNKQITTTFRSEEPIKVYGLSAVKMSAEINNSINNDAFYFNLSIENVSSINVYLPSIGVIDDVLHTYLTLAGQESSEAAENAPTVTHLNTVLSNTEGFSQAIGTDRTIITLAPGEKMTKKYVAYNVVGFDGPLHLKDAIATVVEGYGVNFEVIATEMDLFDMSNTSEKLAAISGNKLEMYNYIKNHNNFFSSIAASDYGDFNDIGQQLDLLGLMTSWGDLESSDYKGLTRALVVELLSDEAAQQVINAKIDTKYLDITKSVVGFMATCGKDAYTTSTGVVPENFGEFVDGLNTLMQDGEKMRSLASALKKDGPEGFLERLGYYVGTKYGGFLSIEILRQTKVLSLFSDACSGIADTVSTVSQYVKWWNEDVELLQQMINIAAAQEEAEFLLDMLIEHLPLPASGTIRSELKEIRNSLDHIEIKLADQVGDQLAGAIGSLVSSSVVAILISVYGSGFSIAYTFIKLAISALEYITGWNTLKTNVKTLRLNLVFSWAMVSAVNQYGLDASSNEEAQYTLRALKYLIKMRIKGENDFVDVVNTDEHFSEGVTLAYINARLDANYASLDDYAKDVTTTLLTFRDTMFATYYTVLDIPDAPSVGINFQTCTTKETFSAKYEYSFEGSSWYDCDGSAITVTPGTVTRWLWVRVKGTADNVAGNIRKVAIPARPTIVGVPTTEYNSEYGYYTVTGLTAGEYLYAFSDSETSDNFRFLTCNGGTLTLIGNEKRTYLLIQIPATETSFSSIVYVFKTVWPEDSWMLDSTTGIASGIQEKTMGKQIYEYYTGLGKEVTIKDAYGNVVDVNADQLIGTGCKLTVGNETFTVIILGDVDGDGELSIDDLFAMLDHINGEADLTDEYLDAAKITVSDADDIDLDDIMALIDTLNDNE